MRKNDSSLQLNVREYEKNYQQSKAERKLAVSAMEMLQ